VQKIAVLVGGDGNLTAKNEGRDSSVIVPFVFWGEILVAIKFAARPLIAFVFASFLSFPSVAHQTPPPSNPAPPAAETETSAKPAAPGQENSPEAKGQGAPAASPQSPSDKDKDNNPKVRAAKEKMREPQMTGFSLRCRTS
jgi:hypothetical protein